MLICIVVASPFLFLIDFFLLFSPLTISLFLFFDGSFAFVFVPVCFERFFASQFSLLRPIFNHEGILRSGMRS